MIALLAAVLAACEAPPSKPSPPEAERLSLEPAGFGDLAGWGEDRLAQAVPALQRSCAALAKLPDEDAAGPAGSALKARDWRAPCEALGRLPAEDDGAARAYFEAWFQPFLAKSEAGSAGAHSEGLFTGYYEPELRGARVADAQYAIPLYGRPRDLVTVDLGAFDDSLKGKHIAGHVAAGRLEPYATRAEIEAGAIQAEAPSLLWVADPIELFFLQIQGSGRVLLPDGSVVRVGYAAGNGRSYRSIGKLLVERGIMTLEQVSLQSLKSWLRDHPGEAKSLMDQNASYVFFRVFEGEGPVGAEGVELTAGRSLAIDPRFLAYGLPIWLDIETPETSDAGARLRRLVIAQDTGGAIKGPLRGDLFWGPGVEAERLAGPMRSHGRYYLLLPRQTPIAALAPEK